MRYMDDRTYSFLQDKKRKEKTGWCLPLPEGDVELVRIHSFLFRRNSFESFERNHAADDAGIGVHRNEGTYDSEPFPPVAEYIPVPFIFTLVPLLNSCNLLNVLFWFCKLCCHELVVNPPFYRHCVHNDPTARDSNRAAIISSERDWVRSNVYYDISFDFPVDNFFNSSFLSFCFLLC